MPKYSITIEICDSGHATLLDHGMEVESEHHFKTIENWYEFKAKYKEEARMECQRQGNRLAMSMPLLNKYDAYLYLNEINDAGRKGFVCRGIFYLERERVGFQPMF